MKFRYLVLLSIISITIGFAIAEPLLESIPTDPIAYRKWKIDYVRESRGLGDEIDADMHTFATTEPMLWITDNGYVQGIVDELSGEFDVGGDPSGTGSYKKLTFSWPSTPGTEWVMYWVDSVWAKTDAGLPITSIDFKRGDTVFSIWNNWRGVKIEQQIFSERLGDSPGDLEMVKFKATITCSDTCSHWFGLIVYFDTMLDLNDGAPISTAFGYVGRPQIFFDTLSPGIPPIWHAYELTFPPAPVDIVATGILRGFEARDNPPNVFWYGNWAVTWDNGWADTLWIADTTGGFTHDTATMAKWYPVLIRPGDTLVYVTYYGLGEVDVGLEFEHFPQKFHPACGDVSPNPFTIEVILTNGNTADLTNVQVVLDYFSSGLEHIGGASNPITFPLLSGFGGTQVIDWIMSIPESLFNDSLTYNIFVLTESETLWDTFWIHIPDDIPMVTFDSLVFFEETDCDSQNIVDVCYHVITCDNLPVHLNFSVSIDEGDSWHYPEQSNLLHWENNIGDSIRTGVHCFKWNLSDDLPETEIESAYVKISYGDFDLTRNPIEIITNGSLDSKAPELVWVVPSTLLYIGDTMHVNVSFTDMFGLWDMTSILIDYCEATDTFMTTESFDWLIPTVECKNALISISAQDSFCNHAIWEHEFEIRIAGRILIAFPKTFGVAGETIVIPIYIEYLELPRTSGMKLDFSLDSKIAVPIDFTPAVIPTPSDVSLSGAGDNWTISIDWPIPTWFEGDLLGTLTLEISESVSAGEFTPIVINSFNADLMETSWENGAIFVNYSVNPWLQTIYFEDNTKVFGLSFGIGYRATDGYDPGLDVLYLPPAPTELKAFFEINDPLYPSVTQLARDIKDVEPINLWTIFVDYDKPVTVHWEPGIFTDGVFMLNNVIDMKVDTLYISEPYETLYISWSMPDMEISSLALDSGWNLVSLPTRNPTSDAKIIFPGILGPYSYNQSIRSFRIAKRVQPGESYWIYSNSAFEIPLIGDPVNSFTCEVFQGWNFIGAPYNVFPIDSIVTSDSVSIIQVSGWNGMFFTTPDNLEPTKGYIFLIRNSGTVTIGKE